MGTSLPATYVEDLEKGEFLKPLLKQSLSCASWICAVILLCACLQNPSSTIDQDKANLWRAVLCTCARNIIFSELLLLKCKQPNMEQLIDLSNPTERIKRKTETRIGETDECFSVAALTWLLTVAVLQQACHHGNGNPANTDRALQERPNVLPHQWAGTHVNTGTTVFSHHCTSVDYTTALNMVGYTTLIHIVCKWPLFWCTCIMLKKKNHTENDVTGNRNSGFVTHSLFLSFETHQNVLFWFIDKKKAPPPSNDIKSSWLVSRR